MSVYELKMIDDTGKYSTLYNAVPNFDNLMYKFQQIIISEKMQKSEIKIESLAFQDNFFLILTRTITFLNVHMTLINTV